MDMTYFELKRVCVDAMGELAGELDYFGGMWPAGRYADERLKVPDCRWLAAFAVTGGSEGHYIHVEAIGTDDGSDEGGRRLVLLGKTFQGMDHALACVSRISKAIS